MMNGGGGIIKLMEDDTQQVNTATQPTLENETPANIADDSHLVEETPRTGAETVATLPPTVAEIRMIFAG